MNRVSMGKACQILGVCRHTMRRYCEEGIVDGIKLPAKSRRNGHWRISEESLLALTSEDHAKALALLKGVGICVSK